MSTSQIHHLEYTVIFGSNRVGIRFISIIQYMIESSDILDNLSLSSHLVQPPSRILRSVIYRRRWMLRSICGVGSPRRDSGYL